MTTNQDDLLNNIVLIVKSATRNNDVTIDSEKDTTSGWDSMAYMSIISEVEVKYDISINEDNIQKFNSIRSIADIIK